MEIGVVISEGEFLYPDFVSHFNFFECIYDSLLHLRIFEDFESTLRYKQNVLKIVLEGRYIIISIVYTTHNNTLVVEMSGCVKSAVTLLLRIY